MHLELAKIIWVVYLFCYRFPTSSTNLPYKKKLLAISKIPKLLPLLATCGTQVVEIHATQKKLPACQRKVVFAWLKILFSLFGVSPQVVSVPLFQFHFRFNKFQPCVCVPPHLSLSVATIFAGCGASAIKEFTEKFQAVQRAESV